MSRNYRSVGILLVVAVGIGGVVLYLQRPAGNMQPPNLHPHAENSVELSDAKVAAAGIELKKAGPSVLHDSLFLNGILQPNQEALVQVTPRFSGIVRDVHKRIGDRVEKGDLLGTVESNQIAGSSQWNDH